MGEARRGAWSRVLSAPDGPASPFYGYTLSPGTCYRLEAVTFHLLTAAGGGNRQVQLELRDALGDAVAAAVAPGVQAGGVDVLYSFAPNVAPAGSAAAGVMVAPMAGGRVAPNLTLAVGVVGVQAGDQVTRWRVLVAEQPEPQG